MASEIDMLNYTAAQEIVKGNYQAAIKALADGSGDLQTCALLSIAWEIAGVVEVLEHKQKAEKK